MSNENKKVIMLGNEAIARGAYEAGVKVSAAYPGTPSTEISEHIVKYKDDIYAEWSPNEKVATEVAIGASVAGVRSMACMKHVGLNVAADPLYTVSYMVENYADKGIYLTVCGFGSGNLNDSMMETISNKGNGTYQYIDSELEMVKVFVHENSKFYSVANDTKVQITFDPAKVDSYRLIGYENRVMSNEDFENDNKDAGEIGAGQTITALYEIISAGQSTEDQQIAVFDVRYKKALDTESILLTENVFEFIAPESDQKELSFAAGVAAFGMILRNSQYKGTADFDMAYELVGRGLENDPHGYRAELQELITTAKGIASK